MKVPLPRAAERGAFLAWLDALPDGVLRAKGVVQLEGEDVPSLLQYVAGRHELTPLRGSSFAERFVVLIGRVLDPAALGRAFGNAKIS